MPHKSNEKNNGRESQDVPQNQDTTEQSEDPVLRELNKVAKEMGFYFENTSPAVEKAQAKFMHHMLDAVARDGQIRTIISQIRFERQQDRARFKRIHGGTLTVTEMLREYQEVLMEGAEIRARMQEWIDSDD